MSADALFAREALSQLEALHNFALRLCGNRQCSSDLVQETMLKAYSSFHSYSAGTNCRAWLFQICKNSYINTYRRRSREPLLFSFQEESNETRSAGQGQRASSPPSTLQDHSQALQHTCMVSDEVATAIDRLPPDYQTAVMLCDIEGYTYKEIAQFTRSRIGTVRSRIHRGRKMLAGHLTQFARQSGYLRASHGTNN